MLDPENDARMSWARKRHAKMAEEIARNRRGEYTVPTWVLAVALLALVAGWAAVVLFS